MLSLPSQLSGIDRCVFLAAAVALAIPATEALAQPKQRAASFKPVLAAEAKSQTLCEAAPNRVFVRSDLGSECISYWVTKGFESVKRAVFVIDGDATPDKFADPSATAQSQTALQTLLQRWSNTLTVPYVAISRAGLNGSSGHHGDRRKPKETLVMDGAIDLIKAKLGIETIALAGQSGGSTIAASLLTMGRRDVRCAALGSGAFEVVDLHHATVKAGGSTVSRTKLDDAMFDPARDADLIPPDAARRVFIIGDTADSRTPFAQQQRYVQRLRALGHHAELVPVNATGALDHAAIHYALPTAGGCLMGTPDAKLLEANQNMSSSGDAAAVALPVSPSIALMKQAR